MSLSGLFFLLRPKQWIKNGFVLAPLLFSGSFMEITKVMDALTVMFLFCVASSAGYIVNDIHDKDYDRKHVDKAKKRPIASGLVSITQAVILLFFLYAVLVAYYFIDSSVALVLAVYVTLNLTYTYRLKHMPVVDIFSIAFGFVLRVYGGTVALDLPPSHWMFVTTLCLALFLAAIKRRQELLFNGREGRKVLEHYTIKLVDRFAEMAATGTLVFYSLFVMTIRPELVITIPLVLFGLFRYWFIVESLQRGESPTDVVLTDIQLIITILLWVAVSTWALWSNIGINHVYNNFLSNS